MAAAAILSLEDFRDTQRRAVVRQRLHDRFDHWRNQLEDHMQDQTPTLKELTQAVFALRQELTQAVTEGLVEQAHRALVEQRTAACPRCGQMLSARGPHARTVETLVGAIRLQRPYCYCERCQVGTAPWDEALQVTARRKQPDVQQAAVQLTKAVPDETAWELFAELTGLPLSAHTAHEVTQAVAAGLTVLDVAPSREEIAKLIPSLQRHQERLDSRFARKGGYPMGSGGIESANKFICHVRLKRSGAWWYVTNANQMLALRCAKYNGTFDRVFARYRQRLQDRSG